MSFNRIKRLLGAGVFFIIIAGNLFAQENTGEDTPIKDEAPVQFFSFQIIPGLDIIHPRFGQVTNIFLFGASVGKGYRLKGVASASIGIINSGRVQGLQFSGVFNIAQENMDGAQTASIFNSARGLVRGVQAAGVYNYASGKFEGIQIAGLFNRIEGDMWGVQLAPVNFRGEGGGVGVQVGLVNFSKSGNVIPIGLVNNIKDGIKHFSVFMDDMMFLNAGYRSGSRIFYTHTSYGIGGGLLGKNTDNLIISRGGFGFEFPINKFFIDIDMSRGNILSINSAKDWWKFFFGSNTSIFQLRLIVGYKFLERLGIFAGISYDYLQQSKDSDPSPAEFCGVMPTSIDGKNTHKMGFFGGLQF